MIRSQTSIFLAYRFDGFFFHAVPKLSPCNLTVFFRKLQLLVASQYSFERY